MDGGRLSSSPQKTPTLASMSKPFACENLPFKRLIISTTTTATITAAAAIVCFIILSICH